MPFQARFKRAIALLTTFGATCAMALILASCGSKKQNDIAIIWTDQADFASYAELFNKDQSRYHIVVEYRENPAGALIAAKETPDIVIGPWLKGEKARSRLEPVDYLFNELRISAKLFYGPLLDLGNVGGRQYLLPVSFNMPAIIFSPDRRNLVPNDFALSLDEIKSISREYNVRQKGQYTRMGFSPRWDREFLYITAQLFNTRFEEDSHLIKWNASSLSEATDYLANWTKTSNSTSRAEDDFQFKYLYDPPYKLVTGGRNLFSYIPSDALFTLPQDKLQNVDFRWITKDGKAAVSDGIIYLGICKKARNLDAAEAFLIWFFNEKTQKRLLVRSRDLGVLKRSFGISGGFSALKPVNEKAFPLLYPSLLGHLPPADSLLVPKILPNNWEVLKREIVIPYLADAVSDSGTKDSLHERIDEWIKAH
jgi:ABC-type glycerol-3-phosphate transport system substrate-binding protein